MVWFVTFASVKYIILFYKPNVLFFVYVLRPF